MFYFLWANFQSKSSSQTGILSNNGCHLRTFDPEKDQHPVSYLVNNLKDGLYAPMMQWMNDMGANFGDPSAFQTVTRL